MEATMAQFLRTRYVLAVNAGALPECLLTFYWDGTGGTDTALVTEAHARVRAYFAAFATRIMGGSTLAFTYPEGDFIEETTGQIVSQAVGSIPAAVSFTATGDPLPTQTQALVQFRSGTFINGRRVVGRQYIPGLSETANDTAGAVATAVRTDITTGLNALGTTIVTPMGQRIWHRPVNGAGGLSVPVTARSVSNQWSVLRSRRA